ncbi:hypothetical protein L2E82_09927 [Cichorium intybus]|uniref:Uncharacterized protein n=1 Tax=Cichorium intybus TaxID=13427 RepID=A0ACB9GA17_CICIN|nr:hypothetical protein L2E82_09927 [Cichorium intybus]
MFDLNKSDIRPNVISEVDLLKVYIVRDRNRRSKEDAISAGNHGIEVRNWNHSLELVIPMLIKCTNRDWPGDLHWRQAQCAQEPGGVRPGAVRPGAVRPVLGAVWDKMVVVHAKARNNRDLNAANIQHNPGKGKDKVRDSRSGLVDTVSSSPALKETMVLYTP